MTSTQKWFLFGELLDTPPSHVSCSHLVFFTACPLRFVLERAALRVPKRAENLEETCIFVRVQEKCFLHNRNTQLQKLGNGEWGRAGDGRESERLRAGSKVKTRV